MIGHVRPYVGTSETRLPWGRVFSIAALLLLADLVLSLVLGTLQLRHAGHLLEDALASLGRDEVAEADENLRTAHAALRSSSDLLGHPGVAIAGLVPPVADDIRALKTLAAVGTRSVAAAREITSALWAAGAGDLGIAGVLYGGGAFDLAATGELEEAARRAVVHLESASRTLEALDADPVGPLARALVRAERRLVSSTGAAHRAMEVAALIPQMSGREGERRYLLAFQSPSEARGGGGVIGVYGILSASEGRLGLEEIGPIEVLGPTVRPPVSAPPSFEQLFGPLSALQDWRQANLSPTFPVTSEVLIRMFKRVRGERLDGVIAMDPLALGQLTRGLPGLEADGWNKTITNDNARRLLLFDIYTHFVHRERVQNHYLRDLVKELWTRVAGGEVEAAGLLRGFVEAVSKQHVKIFSTFPEEQRMLASLGVVADPRAVEGPLQAIYNNNNSGNKLDFFLRRKQSTSIVLTADGSAEVTTTLELHNDLPRRGIRAMSRSGVRNSDLELGENRMSLHFMLPSGAHVESWQIDGVESRPYRGRDGGLPVSWQVLTLGSEEKRTVTVTYRFPHAIGVDDIVASGGAGAADSATTAAAVFRFTLWPQTTARPDAYELQVTAPDGYSFRVRGGDLRGRVRFAGDLKTPETVVLPLSQASPGP